MKINVTQEWINCGIKGSAFSCPIALAVRHALNPKNLDDISVTKDGIKLWAGINVSWYKPASREIIDFIDDFDKGKPVSPFEFELDIP